MRRFLLLSTLMAAIGPLSAQTLNVRMGSVTYAIAAADAGLMTYSGGSQLTIGQRTYPLSSVTGIDIDRSEVVPGTVSVSYDGATARVVIPGDLAAGIDATVQGAHVTLIDNGAVAANVTYRLSGSSPDGSFYLDGKQDATCVLDGLQLTCPDSSAVCIQNGRQINLRLADGTSSSLADGLTTVTDDGSDAHKAPLFINGRSTWSGSGSLTLTGNVRHGYCSDAYTVFGAGLGTVSVLRAPTDGLHVNEYFLMQGGTVSINSTSDGIDTSSKLSSTDAANGTLTIAGGTLTVATTGAAAKGLKSDAGIVISGGTVDVSTSGGGTYEYEEGTLDLSSCAAAKTSGTFSMTGGTVHLTSTGAGGKGINAAGNITLAGGQLTVVTTGAVYVYSTDDAKPQGVKSRGNIILSGGTILVCASADSGTAFKTDNYVYTNGATVMGIGAKALTPGTASTARYKRYSNVSVKGGQTLSYDGVSFTIPSAYSNGSAKVLVSSASM